ncbi:MAG: GGDEF domain-containing protein [Thermodesulfobacteriota bacterium]|nr:GGDEF domain-containing protein [Thermodesulfobacteriota bacterium]
MVKKSSRPVLRTLFSFFVPGGILLLAVAILIYTGVAEQSFSAILPVYPWAIFGGGIFLACRFNKSRVVFALLVLALADRSLHFFNGSADAVHINVVYSTVVLLFPLNLAAFSLLKERGIATLRGILRLGLILAQPVGIAAICYLYPHFDIAGYLGHSFVDVPVLARTSLTQPALPAFFAAFLFLIIRFILYQDAVVGAFFWALVLVFLALGFEKFEPVSPLFFATAGLILVTSIIETSHSMAYRDELTQLPTIRALKEAFLKLGNRYTVAMVDIDSFKKFNDRYGHDVGDQVLQMVASKLANVGGGGKSFRYGGEEFTLIFPGSLMEVIPHVEKLRKTIEESEFMLRRPKRPRKKPKTPIMTKEFQEKVSVTISVGVAEQDDQNKTPKEVLRAADKAMYRAKNSGRNCVSA